MRIPVIILSGFLGSGKTTLLLSLLKESYERGLQPGVLMNELGKQDVDGYILEEQTGAAVEKLLDGCVCCSRREELGDSLEVLIKRRPDVIFIELTGVADPDEIARSLHEPYLATRLSAHAVVTLVDAENMLDYNSRLSSDKQLVRTLRSQLSSANLIIVNKSDLVTPEILTKIEKAIRKRNANAKIEFTAYSRIQVQPLLAGIVPKEAKPLPIRAPLSFQGSTLRKTAAGRSEAVPDNAPGEHAASFTQVGAVTLAFPQGKTLPKAVLEEFFREWADRLLRAKGHVQLPGGKPVQLVQHAGSRTTWEDSRYPGSPYLVFIGTNINGEQLAERWSALFR
ncbi:GTPase, G3E family [Paenibacillus sophorae]|uniref:GTP-binding protein n=1 Tax=Paenibacillus sophorae TaxID=1333845 RepID=A0A1H8TTP6_9BACL|nr:CobW family GTP-binding protein [Paenibacillus sophorae]QWU18023.1 GTP-binding protein [Paenibacillus sophorae]SEO94215.1 GTPase, G3E family [Paenibacillus sophorae]